MQQNIYANRVKKQNKLTLRVLPHTQIKQVTRVVEFDPQRKGKALFLKSALDLIVTVGGAMRGVYDKLK